MYKVCQINKMTFYQLLLRKRKQRLSVSVKPGVAQTLKTTRLLCLDTQSSGKIDLGELEVVYYCMCLKN